MNNKLIIGFIVIAALIVGTSYVYTTFVANKNTASPLKKEENRPLETTNSNETPRPTKTPQEIKIISEIKDHTISIKDNAFSPETVTIKVNDQVIWENNDNTQHQVKGDDWGGVTINNGERFTQAFDKSGTYQYYCTIHPEMKGTIIVK